MSSTRTRRLLWALGASVVVLACLRALAPLAVEIALERIVSGRLPGTLQLGDVELSLHSGAIDFVDVELLEDGKPVLTCRRLSARIDLRALPRRQLRVQRLDVEAPFVEVARLREWTAAPAASETPEPEVTDAPPVDGSPGGSAWPVFVERVDVSGGRIRLVLPDALGTLELSPERLALRNLSWPGGSELDPPELELAATLRVLVEGAERRRAQLEGKAQGSSEAWALELELTEGDEQVVMSADVGVAAAGSRGSFSWEQLDLVRLMGVLSTELPPWLREARSSGALEISAPAWRAGGSDGLPQRIEGSGRIALEDLHLGEGDEEEAPWHLRLAGLEAEIDSVRWETGDEPQLQLALGRLRASSPRLRLLRDESGLALPWQGNETGGAGLRTSVSLTRLDIGDAELTLVDRAVRPFRTTRISGLELQGTELALPELEGRLEAEGVGPGDAPLRLACELEQEQTHFDVALADLELAPFNPYWKQLSGYAVGGGRASLDAEGLIQDGHYQGELRLLFDDLELSGEGSEDAFRKRYGVPLSLGLALLKDSRGDIELKVPVSGPVGGQAGVDLAPVLIPAIRRTIASALAAPLRLAGAVVLRGERVEGFVPEPLGFEPGGLSLTEQGKEGVAALAELLARRPGIAVELSGHAALAEEALLEAWQDDEAGPRPSDLEALAAARAARVAELLRSDHGVHEGRAIAAGGSVLESAEPSVSFQIGVASSRPRAHDPLASPS